MSQEFLILQASPFNLLSDRTQHLEAQLQPCMFLKKMSKQNVFVVIFFSDQFKTFSLLFIKVHFILILNHIEYFLHNTYFHLFHMCTSFSESHMLYLTYSRNTLLAKHPLIQNKKILS